MSTLLSKKFLIDIGCEQPHRYFDNKLNQFRVYFKIDGYDCDLFISPLPQIVGNGIDDIAPAQQMEQYSDIEFLTNHHTGDWSVYVNNIKNHLVVLHTEGELLNLLKACKCPKL